MRASTHAQQRQETVCVKAMVPLEPVPVQLWSYSAVSGNLLESRERKREGGLERERESGVCSYFVCVCGKRKGN